MDISRLFCGPVVVIDDEVGVQNTNIGKLLAQIEGRNMPCAKYSELPDEAAIDHFGGVSFVVLDWLLKPLPLAEVSAVGVILPQTVISDIESRNIAFLKELRRRCFVPVFIFTDQSPEEVKAQLSKAGLYQEGKPNFILVAKKSDLTGQKLFDQIASWLKTSPSVYALKQWEREYEKAKNRLFLDWFALSPSWPTILWRNSQNDSVDQSHELTELISRNLETRMTPVPFVAEYINNSCNGQPSRDELCKVIEGQRFVGKESLQKDDIGTGDVFKLRVKEGRKAKSYYFLNIRPQRDCLLRPESGGRILARERDKVQLYLLRGVKMGAGQVADAYIEKYGHLGENVSHAKFFCLEGGKTIQFDFKTLHIKTWRQMKTHRIGRVLPPFITNIQQRYGLYAQRMGLPRLPADAVICPPQN